MTIQRQYNLPNCTLTLEGLGDAVANPADLRPVMSILTNAECRLLGQSVIHGGKDFFEQLVATVSLYAQEVLSEIRVPVMDTPPLINLERVGPDQHQLTFAPENGEQQVLALNTVQLFDLVEAIDQFIADSQTLPQWSLGLKPASKRYAPKAPISQQAMPIATGLGSLALAAAAFAAIPAPEVKTPQDLTYQPTTTASPAANDGLSDKLATASPSATSTPASDNPTPIAESDNRIQDPAVLSELGNGLEKQLQANFNPKTPVATAVSYEVRLGQDGKILAYRPSDDAAANSENQTPLPNLRYNPVPGSSVKEEAVASFRAVFTPEGTVRVEPWTTAATPPQSDSPSTKPAASPAPPTPAADKSQSTEPQPSTAPDSGNTSSEIRQRSQLVELQPKLYNRIDQAWKAPSGLAFNEKLIFSVRVDGDGKMLDFSPYNDAARAYKTETPLPDLGKEGNLSQTPNGQFARFKVVFTPAGRLEVNPWDGYPEEKSAE